ncbi:AMP-binding protein [Pseudomonas gingeri]|uniref:condensation domain-containing protein n=1 Tax=Pseudomonas gingeri TaxID=117681 RepID=UPI0015A3F69B|nr:condensation domain-containing protein [Pseudomonas gingeri]NWA27645.1 AMP-binding protein [Pseudomonas gingeri]
MLEGLMQGCWLRGIRLSVRDGQLHMDAAPEGVLSAELAEQLDAQRPQVVQWLIAHPEYFTARPLTDNEQALFFLHRMAPQSCAYNIAYAVRLNEAWLDAGFSARLERAWLTVQARHPQLCSAFAERDGRPLQWYRQPRPRPLEHDDLPAADAASLQQRVAELADKPFDLESGEVSRAVLLSVPGQAAVLVLGIHHIASDLETFYIIADELFALLKGEPLGDVDPEAYHHWCSELQLQADLREPAQLAWWQAELAEVPTLELPTDFPYGSSQAFKGGEMSFRLPGADAERLRAVAQSFGVTPFAYWFALFQQFLGVLSGQQDFVLGTPSGWRLKRAHSRLPGYLVNPLPVRCRLRPELSSGQWAQQVAQQFKQALRQRKYPFSRLIKQLDLPRQMGRAPLFQHMFTLNRERTAPFEQDVQRLLSEQRGAAHELNLVVIDDEQGFLGRWRYNEALYRRETVEGYRDQFNALVLASIEQPDVPFNELAWLSDRQRSQVQGESLALPVDNAWQAFVQQCAQRPDALAIEDQQGTLSYRQLAAAVLGRSERLQALQVGVADRVALCLPRSRELVMHMLASWQSGATYMALDPNWPDARLQGICEDASPRLWISQGQRPQWLPASVQWLALPEPGQGQALAAGTLRTALPAGQAAYVVYTSGSSGQPKGVQVSQGNLIHYVAGCLQRLQLGVDASLSSLASCATDLGHTALFGALLSGRRLRLLDEELAFDAEALAQTLGQQPVDLLKIVPSHLNALLIASEPQRLLPRQCLVVGGEALSEELVARVRALAPGLRILNHYGPSETTVGVLTQDIIPQEAISLGRPLPNVSISVRGPNGAVLPVGVIGELCIQGPTVALGYLRAPASDLQRFTEYGYRTGDRVRLNAQGQVLFLGRLDEQVKIRGYRVEPGEIAEQLRGLEAVGDARVLNIPVAPSGNRLVAFVLAAEAALPGIQQGLAARLPDYMQPARWFCLEVFPLLANGKVDRRALVSLAEQTVPQTAVSATAESAGPTNSVEQRLLDIAAEILGKPDLRLDDNFFAVGGDSILSLQIIARAKQQGLKLTPKQIFEFPSVSGWATRAVDLSLKRAPAPSYSLPTEAFALTPIQNWYVDHQIGAPAHWNQSLLLTLQQPLEAARFAEAARSLLQRHASLRLMFAPRADGQGWEQRYQALDERGLSTLFEVVEAPVDDALLEHYQTGMQLDRAPLIRWVYFSHSQQLLCTAHHLIIDSVSWQILLPELESLYLGDKAALTPVSASFHQWGEALQAHSRSASLQEQRGYWQEQLSAEHAPAAVDNRYGSSRTLDSQLSAELTQALLGDCHDAYGTQVQDLMIAALAETLGSWLGRERITIELESHGRSAWEQAPDLSRSVGWHTSRYPLLLSVHDDTEQSIVAAKEALRRVPEQGIGYGLLRQDPANGLGAAQLLSFNYLGRVDQWLGASRLWQLEQPLCPGMRAADGRRSHLLDVNALVIAGRLHIEWRYAPALHDVALVGELARQFQQRLGALIEHCLAPAAGRATASDFADSGLSDDEFLGLLEQL